MEELKKEEENQMEENKNEEGGTPTPSQEENNDEQQPQQQEFTDNSDLTPEEFEKELSKGNDNDASNSVEENKDDLSQNDAQNETEPNTADGSLDENSNPFEDKNKPQEKLLTQSQVNELVGKARKEGRESAMKDLLLRYGVNDENELNDIFGRGQAYDDLDYDYQNQGKSYKDAMAENALLKSHIDESRWDDVKLILSGKGLEINAENIATLLPTHPEWNGNNLNGSLNGEPKLLTQDMADQMVNNEYQNAANQIGSKKPGVLKKLGNEPNPPAREKTEEELAAELYGW